MKKFLALALIASSAHAQQQEQKLVDRLLRPDMSLESSQQKKKFVADGVSVDKRTDTRAFNYDQKAKPKEFAGARDYSSKQFASNSFYNGRDHSTFATRSTSSSRTYPTSTSALVRPASDATRSKHTGEFAGQRPFLDRGKSEKSVEFQRKNKPMSIEDVRELLNKNK